MIDLDKMVRKHERYEDVDDMLLAHKNGKDFMDISFPFDDVNQMVFVNEIIPVKLTKDVLLVTGDCYSKGSTVYVEKNFSTPLIYDHELPYKDLINYVEQNYKQIDDDDGDDSWYISSLDGDWHYFKEFIPE